MSKKIICCVTNCLSTSTDVPKRTFFRLPSNLERRVTWLRLISRNDLMDKNIHWRKICDKHFEIETIFRNSFRLQLKRDTLPTLNLPIDQLTLQKILDEYTEDQIAKENAELQHNSIRSAASCKFQPYPSLSPTTPFTRKLKTYERRSKQQNENSEFSINKESDGAHDKKINMLCSLCDIFLTTDLCGLIYAQIKENDYSSDHKYSFEYKLLCMNLFYACPQAYRVFQETLRLPNPRTIVRDFLPITTDINEHMMIILKAKVHNMTSSDKICSVVVDTISLKTSLFYHIHRDNIIGFHEVNGVQTPVPANNALVIMIRGIIGTWTQPIAFALLADPNNCDNIDTWIDQILEILIEIGLDVRTFVSNLKSDLLYATAKKKAVSNEEPYFFVNNHKIYCIFDAPNALTMVRNNLMSHDFYFQGSVAKWEHIQKFYEIDQTKCYKIAHKLSDSHLTSTNEEKNAVLSAQLLSRTVATGISTYVDSQEIDESAKDTCTFIMKVNDLYDLLNNPTLCYSNDKKLGYCGETSQKHFLNEMIDFFKSIQVINPLTGQDMTTNMKFIEAFQVTIKSILLLFRDLKKDGLTTLHTKHLNQGVIEDLFHQIQTKDGQAIERTSREFISAFERIFINNIIKPPKQGKSGANLKHFLAQKERLESCFSSLVVKIKTESSLADKINFEIDTNECSVPNITKSDYNKLNMPENNSLMFICEYLLKKASEVHTNCETFHAYLQFHASQYIKVEDTDDGPIILPNIPPDFLTFVQQMENEFQDFFEKKVIKHKVAQTIFDNIMLNIEYSPPCPCFPQTYLKKLFIRLKLFYTLKFNNKAFRTSRQAKLCMNLYI